MAELKVMAPLRLEALALGGSVGVTGKGPERSQQYARALVGRLHAGTAVALAGVAGALQPGLRPGDLVVATEVRTTEGGLVRSLPGAELVAAELRRSGLEVATGPVVSSPRFISGSARSALARSGALAVDMESAWVAGELGERPVSVLRAIADTPGRGVVLGGMEALRSLGKVRSSLQRWAAACTSRSVLLASPRSFCAGVERAIEIVERALERFGPPVYVRRQIVHNTHVVKGLEGAGAVFVEELDQVPDDAVVILAAHGVSPVVRREAENRNGLVVIDATCPLVAKVHYEARRFASLGLPIVLIGHLDHEEVIGTVGEVPGAIHVISSSEQVSDLPLDPKGKVACLTQTTLASDETSQVLKALRERFDEVVTPASQDICYATENRQAAVRELIPQCDLILVVGSSNSSNTARLVEVARRAGQPAELIEDQSQLRLSWLEGARTIGLTAGASAPDAVVHRVIDALRALGPVVVSEQSGDKEYVHFNLPRQVR